MTVWESEYTNPDGTVVPRDERSPIRDNLPVQVPRDASLYVDDFTALQLGMWLIIDALEFTTIDRVALVARGRVESNTMKVTRVFFDWPDIEDDIIPVPSATIMAPQEVELELPGPLSGQPLLEETVDVYRSGTALRRLYELKATLEVVFWLQQKDDRAGLRKGLVEAFHEPGDEFSGRRVSIPWYFDRVARFDLRGIAYEDSSDFARGKTWPLTARFTADIEAVSLVDLPATIREPRINVAT
jgi:hypothetical protein